MDEQPTVVTPLESEYIKAAITGVLPAINGLIYATNLDELLHITSVTTNQVWQVVMSGLTIWALFKVVRKRLKDGNDPNSTAPKVVMSKPDPPPLPTVGGMSNEELIALIASMKKPGGK